MKFIKGYTTDPCRAFGFFFIPHTYPPRVGIVLVYHRTTFLVSISKEIRFDWGRTVIRAYIADEVYVFVSENEKKRWVFPNTKELGYN